MKRRTLFAAAAVLLTSAFADPSAAPPQKWALIVGVGDYRNYGDEEGGDLAGAAGDARNMREVLLARWGFRAENVRLLTDADATRDAIRTALTEWLATRAQPGDLVVFYFSGHGSQTFDQDGDEDDGLDETICPTDALRNNASHDIKDDELGGWLRGLPTRNVTVILDSCHSGTATRSVAPFARRKALDRSGASDLPADSAARPAGARQASLDGAGPEVLEMSAAQADQYALETTFEENGVSRTGGAFTTPLVRFLWQVSPRTSHQELFRLTREELRRASFAQTPQLSAVPARALAAFALPGTESAAPAAAPPTRVVAAAGPRRVVLAGGSVAGIMAGAYYRAGGSLLRVVSVEPTRALAELVGSGGALPAPGVEAVLEAAPLRPAVLRVSIAALTPAGARAMSAAAWSLPHVELPATRGAPAALVVRPEGSDWVVTGADGAERHRVAAGDPAAAARELAALLRRDQAALELASLENPGYPFAVDFGFAGERNSFRLGETVSFRVRSARAGYLTIVDLDPAGKVTVIFPNRFDAANQIRAGEEVVVPTTAMGFSFQVQEPVGRGVVRAFVTDRPLVLPFTAGEVEAAELVGPALRAAAGAPPAPDPYAVPVASWASAAVVYDFTR